MKEEINKSIIDVNKDKGKSGSVYESKRIVRVTYTAIFATLICIMTAYVCHIPVPISGGYIHIGDSLIYIAASILPKPYAMVAAAIGGGMADLLTAPMWVGPTMIIKALIVLPFCSSDKKVIAKRNIIGAFVAYIISAVGYYIANTVIFGSEVAFLYRYWLVRLKV